MTNILKKIFKTTPEKKIKKKPTPKVSNIIKKKSKNKFIKPITVKKKKI